MRHKTEPHDSAMRVHTSASLAVSAAASSELLVRIQHVAERTGVPEPTLRAWERRYGVPTPQRTDSGYRLYGAAEIEQVMLMRRLCDEGVAAKEAARVVKASAIAPPPVPANTVKPAPADRADVSAATAALEQLLVATANFDEGALVETLRGLPYRFEPRAVLDDVLRPFLAEVGARWEQGLLSVAHEHLAAAAARTTLLELVRMTSPASQAPRALLACFGDEEHDLPLLGFALQVATLGIRPVVLGARTPPSAIRAALVAQVSAFVGLSVTILPAPARARELLDEYAAACGQTPWLVGGGAAATLSSWILARGGRVVGSDAELLALVAR